MVTLTRRVSFSAAHRYDLPDLSPEANRRIYGPCAHPHGHGHDYTCEVTVTGDVDPDTGMILNIADLKQILEEVVVEPLDREFLTRLHPYTRGQVPTCEHLVQMIWQAVEGGLNAAELLRVRLEENEWIAAECRRGKRNEELMVFLTRTYEFCASHRLHSPRLDDAKNQEIFGKCNNPYGHGHNYKLEVTLQGPVDSRTGLMADLRYVDQVVKEEVIDRYDHKYLNLDAPEFRELNPTTENLVKVIWERLVPRLQHPPLYRVTVRETDRNCFSYYGDSE